MYNRYRIIYKMYSNGKCDKNICNLVVNILTNLSKQDKPEIGPKYVNLLCILLAKTHNKKIFTSNYRICTIFILSYY